MFRVILFLLLCGCLDLKAQISEDFSSPLDSLWLADTALYKVVSGQLNLDGSGTDTSYLSREYNTINEPFEWQFDVLLDFSPSNNNRFRFFLTSDHVYPNLSSDAFFLQVGENGSDDELEFYQRNKGEDSLVFRSQGLSLSKSSNELSIQVKQENNQLTLRIDTAGLGLFDSLGSITVNLNSGSSYISFSCKHTSSNANKFFFDNLYVGPVRIDSLAPELINSKVLWPDTLQLQFSEMLHPLQTIQLQLSEAYREIYIEGEEINILLNDTLQHQDHLSLSLTGIEDLAGNVSQTETLELFAYLHQFTDLRITEFMLDPTPPVLLPEQEYIELYNASGLDLDLKGWLLKIDDHVLSLPSFTLPAKEYLLITKASASLLFPDVKALDLSLPSLNNSAGLIQLINPQQELVDEVAYHSDWYQHPAKAEGGWSLSLQDLSYSCPDPNNWKAAVEPEGGSPGKANIGESGDIEAEMELEIEYLILRSPDSLYIKWNQALSELKPIEPKLISLSGIALKSSQQPRADLSLLVFKSSIQQEVEMNLSAKACGQVILEEFTFSIAPFTTLNTQPRFSEVLFEASNEQPEFIELYNHSADYLNLKDLKFGFFDTLFNQVEKSYEITDQNIIWPPFTYLVLSAEPIQTDCKSINISDLSFSLTNSGASLVLIDRSLNIIEQFSYSDELHHQMLPDEVGVSLERLSFINDADQASNWHSASYSTNYSTAGCENSQQISKHQTQEHFKLASKHLSPNNDGYLDVLEIAYKLPNNGFSTSLKLIGPAGYLGHILEPELLNAEGTLAWNGLINGQLMNPGLYIIYVEAIHVDGEIIHQQLPVVINP